MGCLETKWRRCAFPNSLKIDHGASPWCIPALKASWKRRQVIHMAVGTGWWTEHNESKVLWSRGRSVWDRGEKKRSCPFCIGSVRCAPHRLVLRLIGSHK